MWPEIIILSIVTIVLAPLATLWWWKLSDQWVSEEHKRFKSKPKPEDSSNVVVIKTPEDPAP